MGCASSNNGPAAQARDFPQSNAVAAVPSGIDRTVAQNQQGIRRVLHNAIEWRKKSRKTFACFISHHRGQCGEVAHLLHDRLAEMVDFKTCLSSGSLSDVDASLAHLRRSEAVVVLLSERVFTSPSCLLEVKAAIEQQIPIIALSVAHKGHSQERARDFLQHLDERMEQDLLKDVEHFGCTHFPNPGALAPRYLAYQLSSVIPRLAPIPIDLQTGSNQAIQASILDLLKALPEARTPIIHQSFDEWKAKHKDVTRIPLLGERLPPLGAQKCTYVSTLQQATIDFNDYARGSWGLLFSHPGPFTPVCTTELGQMGLAAEEFRRRGVRLCGLSRGTPEENGRWVRDIEHVTPGLSQITYPIICDEDGAVAQRLGMVDSNSSPDPRNPPCRGAFIVGPDGCVKFSCFYPACTGRNTLELVRILDSLQAGAEYDVATPGNWKQGDACYLQADAAEQKVAQLPNKVVPVKLPSGGDYLNRTDIPASLFPVGAPDGAGRTARPRPRVN